jgi:hypothetical protein
MSVPFSVKDLKAMERAVITYARMGGTNMDKPRKAHKRVPANRAPCGGYIDHNGDIATLDMIRAASERLEVSEQTIKKRIQYQNMTVKEALSRPNHNKRA